MTEAGIRQEVIEFQSLKKKGNLAIQQCYFIPGGRHLGFRLLISLRSAYSYLPNFSSEASTATYSLTFVDAEKQAIEHDPYPA